MMAKMSKSIRNGPFYSKRTKEIEKKGNEIEVVIKHNGLQRCFFPNKVIDLFGDIKHHHNKDDESH